MQGHTGRFSVSARPDDIEARKARCTCGCPGSCPANIAAQTVAIPGPAPKDLALTGGTGTYRNIGGDGTLVEFDPVNGKLTLHMLSLVARGGGD